MHKAGAPESLLEIHAAKRSNIVIDGFRISGAVSGAVQTQGEDGAIWFLNTTFQQNEARIGGALSVEDEHDVILEDCQIIVRFFFPTSPEVGTRELQYNS